MVLDPKASAETNPLFVTVATAGLLETQDVAVPDPVNCEDVFGHKTVFPVIVGIGFTVTVTALRTGLTQGPFTPSI